MESSGILWSRPRTWGSAVRRAGKASQRLSSVPSGNMRAKGDVSCRLLGFLKSFVTAGRGLLQPNPGAVVCDGERPDDQRPQHQSHRQVRKSELVRSGQRTTSRLRRGLARSLRPSCDQRGARMQAVHRDPSLSGGSAPVDDAASAVASQAWHGGLSFEPANRARPGRAFFGDRAMNVFAKSLYRHSHGMSDVRDGGLILRLDHVTGADT